MNVWSLLLCVPMAAAFPAEQAASELRELARVVRRLHPNPTRYEPPGSLQARLEALQGELRLEGEVDELRLGRAAHELLSPLGDAHVAISIPPYSSDAPQVRLLPLQLYVTEDSAWVELGPTEIGFASSVLAIDGVPIARVLTDLASLVFVDGHRPDAVRYQLGREFPKFHALRYGFAPHHTITIQGPMGPQDITLTSLSRQELRDLRSSAIPIPWRPKHGAGPQKASLTHTPKGVPVLHLPDFGMRPLDTWLDGLTQLLNSIDSDSPLVLDLRGNEGGFRDAPHALLGLLYGGERFPEWTAVRARFRKNPHFSRNISWPFGAPNERLAGLALRRNLGQWLYLGDPLIEAWTPPMPTSMRDPQKGPTFLLTDAGTQSAANGLVLALKAKHPEVQIVGSSPGGACDVHFGDLPLSWQSPLGHLNLLMSVLEIHHVALPSCQPGQGQIVDLAPALSATNFGRRHDPWFELVDATLSPGFSQSAP
jgi:hypothetical protein